MTAPIRLGSHPDCADSVTYVPTKTATKIQRSSVAASHCRGLGLLRNRVMWCAENLPERGFPQINPVPNVEI